MKHILVISQYFYPEQFRINDMCCEWIKRGYKVTVLTGIPNYPSGKFYDGYGYSDRRTEKWNGIDIIRIPLIPRGHNKLGLIFNYFSFPISGFFWNIKNKTKVDVVFMFETSPMTQCKIGVWYAKKHKVPLYLYVQDLWPENVEIITGIHSRLVLNPIQRMVDKVYKACTDIFVTSPSFRDYVIARNISPDKVHFWPQYAEDFYVPMEKKDIPELKKNGKFRIVFTGNIGYAQGLDILPRTAEILKNRNISNVEFVVVGDGRYYPQFLKDIEGFSEMFTLIPRQPAVRIPQILAACDVAFLSFQKSKLWEATIPAKLQSYMACGMPILASAEGETKKIIEDANNGLCSDLGNPEQLANSIDKIMKMDLRRLGENSRRYYIENFEKEKQLDYIDSFFRRVI